METIVMAINGVLNVLRDKVTGSNFTSTAPTDQKLIDMVTVIMMAMEESSKKLFDEAPRSFDDPEHAAMFYTLTQHHVRLAKALSIVSQCVLALEQASDGRMAAAADNVTLAIKSAEAL